MDILFLVCYCPIHTYTGWHGSKWTKRCLPSPFCIKMLRLLFNIFVWSHYQVRSCESKSWEGEIELLFVNFEQSGCSQVSNLHYHAWYRRFYHYTKAIPSHWSQRAGLGSKVRLLICDPGVTGSKYGNCLSAWDKAAYIWPSPNPVLPGAACTRLPFLLFVWSKKNKLRNEIYQPIVNLIRQPIVHLTKPVQILCGLDPTITDFLGSQVGHGILVRPWVHPVMG